MTHVRASDLATLKSSFVERSVLEVTWVKTRETIPNRWPSPPLIYSLISEGNNIRVTIPVLHWKCVSLSLSVYIYQHVSLRLQVSGYLSAGFDRIWVRTGANSSLYFQISKQEFYSGSIVFSVLIGSSNIVPRSSQLDEYFVTDNKTNK